MKITTFHLSSITFWRALIAVKLVIVGLLASATLSVAADTSLWPKVSPPVPKDPVIEAKIDELIEQMSVEQKVGQIIQAEIQSISAEDVGKYHIGSVLNGGGSWPIKDDAQGPLDGWLALASLFYEASVENGLPIPVLWGTDAVHGHNNVVGATLFPHNIGLGAANNPTLMRDIGAATAREVAVTGIDWTFAPTVAAARDIRWGRTYESYSEIPELAGELGKELILGLQGHPELGNFLSQEKVIATTKHFVGDGGTLMGTGRDGKLDQGDTIISEKDLYQLHGISHTQALEVGTQTVMASFNSWNGDKLHGNKYLLTDILKERMGFDGFVIGDWNGHEQIPGCSNQSCPQAINAGVDLIMVPEDWKAFHANTVKQVESGKITMARLEDAVRRILRVKFRAGMFEDGEPSKHKLAGRAKWVGHHTHRAVARQAVRESLVLLKNNGVLPISPTANMMVGGSGADSAAMQCGGWCVTWQGRDAKKGDYKGTTTIFEGLSEAVRISGGAVYMKNTQAAQAADVAIIVFGETPYAEFEGDLQSTDFNLKNNADFRLMQQLKADGVPVVAVFLSGRPRGVDAAIALADAFVVAWLPGSEGAGVADVLIAKKTPYDFKGRLSFSWPQTGANTSTEPKYKVGFGLTY